MATGSRRHFLVGPACIAATGLLALGCLGTGDDDCYRAAPDSWELTISPADGVQASIDEEINLYLQLIKDPGETCNESWEATCGCTDPQPRPADFSVVDAVCLDGSCDVVRLGAGHWWLVDLSIVPRAATVTVDVTVQASPPGVVPDAEQLTGQYRFQADAPGP